MQESNNAFQVIIIMTILREKVMTMATIIQMAIIDLSLKIVGLPLVDISSPKLTQIQIRENSSPGTFDLSRLSDSFIPTSGLNILLKTFSHLVNLQYAVLSYPC